MRIFSAPILEPCTLRQFIASAYALIVAARRRAPGFHGLEPLGTGYLHLVSTVFDFVGRKMTSVLHSLLFELIFLPVDMRCLLKMLIVHHMLPFPFITAFSILRFLFSPCAQQYTLLVASLVFFVFTLVLLTVLLSPMQTAYAAELEYRTAQVQLAQPVPATGEQMRKSQVCRRVWALFSNHE
jgi:hypothetical protein